MSVSGDIVEKSDAVLGFSFGIGHLADLDVGAVATGLQEDRQPARLVDTEFAVVARRREQFERVLDGERVGFGRLGDRDAVLAVDEVRPVATRAHATRPRRRARRRG